MGVTRPILRVRAVPPVAGTVLRPGMRLGRYELLAQLDGGGMGDVWVGEQSGELGFRRRVAVKVLKRELAARSSLRRMFLDEARLAARIHHVNVVEVLDLGEEEGVVFQVMPLVRGGSAARILSRAIERDLVVGHGVASRISVDMLRGLQAAHDLCDDDGVPLGLLHRDVSPQNVLVGLDGVGKLADFGIAKAYGRITAATEVGQLKGKVGYMAPEQLEGESPTVRSDLFSAGVVLWELLTGCQLFPISDDDDTIDARLRADVPDPREIDPAIPKGSSEVAMRALSRSPHDRFESARQMVQALEDAQRLEGTTATQEEVAALVEKTVGEDARAFEETLRAPHEKVRRLRENEASRTELSAAVPSAAVPSSQDRRAEARDDVVQRSSPRAPDLLRSAAFVLVAAAVVVVTVRLLPSRDGERPAATPSAAGPAAESSAHAPSSVAATQAPQPSARPSTAAPPSAEPQGGERSAAAAPADARSSAPPSARPSNAATPRAAGVAAAASASSAGEAKSSPTGSVAGGAGPDPVPAASPTALPARVHGNSRQ